MFYLERIVLIHCRGGTKLHSICLDPVYKVGNLSVDAVVVGTGTAVAPGHDTGQVGGAGIRASKRSTRVTLARVLSTRRYSSTDHGVLDLALTIGTATLCIRHDGNGHLAEGGGGAAALGGGAPAGDNTVTRGSVTLSWESDALHVIVEGQRLRELQQGDVVADGEGVVIFVLDDLREDDCLFIALIYILVVFSGHDLKVIRVVHVLALDAVTGTDGPVLVVD